MACSSAQTTQRVFEGRSVQGQYIDPEAYAAYAEGSYFEAHGAWAQAESAYLRALDYDDESPEIWTRLGVIRCHEGLSEALDAFEHATRQHDAGGWTERARCLGRHGAPALAITAARRAIELDPSSSEANLLLADLFAGQAQPDLARRWLFAWLYYTPLAAPHWRAVEERARQLGDPELLQLARSARARWLGGEQDGPAPQVSPPLDGASPLAAALRTGSEDAVREAANDAGLSELGLAQAALELGQAAYALGQAELILGADPTSADAIAIASYAAAALGELEPLRRVLREASHADAEPPNAKAAVLVQDLLRWCVDEHAADAWARGYRQTVPNTH
jgi:Tfp pilus assembly protein PilF